MTNLWTKLTTLILVLFGLYSLWYVFGQGQDPLVILFSIPLFVLAGVAWMENRWGTLLVVGVGLIFFAGVLVSAALNLAPEYTQAGQYLYSLIFLPIPTLAYLSYREIRKGG